MEGVIRSFVPEKRYGFIEGHDRKSYFFHVADLDRSARSTDVQEGLLVSFDPTPGPKGLRARRLRVEHAQARMWVPPREFIVSKEDAPRRGTVFFKAPPVEFRSEKGESIDAGKERLIAYAKELGANAILELRYRRDEDSVGNYTYSVHRYSGCLSVVMDSRQTTDAKRARSSEDDVIALAEDVRTRLVALATKHMIFDDKLARFKRRRTIPRLVGLAMSLLLMTSSLYYGSSGLAEGILSCLLMLLIELVIRLFFWYPADPNQSPLESCLTLSGAGTPAQWHSAVSEVSCGLPRGQPIIRLAYSSLRFATSLT